MRSLPTLTHGSASEAARLRQQASELLMRLLADRESSEQRLAAAGKRDPIKTVTGVTALERAIHSTRDMIAEMDLMLADLDCGIQHEQAAPILRPVIGTFRPRSSGMLAGQRQVAATA